MAKRCIDCNKKISKDAKRCQDCYHISTRGKPTWSKGKKLDHPTWNEGRTGVYSKETLKKMSEAKKENPTNYWLGKKRPEITKWLKGFSKGHIPWNKGIPNSKETKRKISEANKGKRNSPATEFKKGENLGKLNLSWKGGRRKTEDGYILVYSPSHPFKTINNYVREHRLVMEKKIGRYLKPKEVVHHINEIRDDNREENLLLFPNMPAHIEHHRLLSKSESNPT